jgi:putative transcriptional regulator
VPTREPDLSQLRAILNARRHEAGLTFEQLAEVAGISRQTLLNISSGKYNGDLKTWIKLSSAFGVGLDEMLAPVIQDPSESS